VSEAAAGSAGRRLSAITIDQAIAGASNVLVTILAARTLTVSAFGLFGVLFLIYVLVQGSIRSLVCDPLLVHPDDADARPGDATASAIVAGASSGLLIVVVGVVTRLWIYPPLGIALVLLGVVVPFLILQDLGRYFGFARQHAGFSVLLDSLWLVLLVPGVVVLSIRDTTSLSAFVIVWGGTGAIAGLITLVRFPPSPPYLHVRWLRTTWAFAWRYVTSFAASQGGALAAALALGGIASAQALGAVRGALLLTRPYSTIQIAAVSGGMAEIARAGHTGAALRRYAARTSLAVGAFGALNGAIMLLLPDPIGELVLGETWNATKPLLLVASIHLVVVGLGTGARAGLLGARAVRTTLHLDLTFIGVGLVTAIIGSVLAGAQGYYWGTVAAAGMATLLWWIALVRHDGSPQMDPRVAEPA